MRPLLGGDDSLENSDGEIPIITLPSSDSAPQYSPSVSHDEKEEEEEKWEGLEMTSKADGFKEDISSKDDNSPGLSTNRFGRENEVFQAKDERNVHTEGDSDEDWGGFEDDGGEFPGTNGGRWGSTWTTESEVRTDSAASSHSQGDGHQTTPIATPTSLTGSGKGKLKLSSKSKTPSESSTNVSSPVSGQPLTKPVASEVEEKLKGRLKREDIERLEQQALLTAVEPDFFADMAPSIGGSNSLFSSPPDKPEVKKAESTATTSALQYQPSAADQVREERERDREATYS